jgi:diguanylate cyclase (GGDEF)-like protein
MMDITEVVIWSAMLGGLLTLLTVAVADVWMNRSTAAWRGLFFVALAGSSAMLLTGLPEALYPQHHEVAIQVLKALLGPLSGALALTYLGMWLGPAADDPVVHYVVRWGSPFLIFSALVLVATYSISAQSDALSVVAITAPINGLGVVLALTASIRAALLGDRLARSMVVACLALAGMVGGLYLHELAWIRMNVWANIATAFCSVSYFLIVTGLSLQRHRQHRKLKRLAALAQGSDPITGLPTASILLSKISDAFWRSARLKRECTVVCLHIHNLYELGEAAGHHVDQQILVTLTARIRRAVGFRNVMGLYHPRCFVVVISAAQQREAVDHILHRIQLVINQPLEVLGLDAQFHSFTPRFGLGVLAVDSTTADPATTLDQVEQLANEVHQHVDLQLPVTAAAPLQ